ncbi:transposase [Pontibacterium granulatum]|nr:transposase [Pontibacterium granulatum]MDI3324369.1 transposase [Pontibacterium granulatum]
MLQQRQFAITAGYEDLYDHERLLSDLALQTTVDRFQPLASPATLYRFEAAMNREAIIESHRLLWEQFITSHRKVPTRIVLDFDATDTPLHDDQPEKFSTATTIITATCRYTCSAVASLWRRTFGKVRLM